MPACSAELRQAPQLFRVAVHWWPWETGRTLSKTSKVLEAMITRKLNSYAAEAGGDSVIGDRGLLAWEMWIWRHPGRENLLAGPSHSNRRPTWVCILLNPVNNIKNKMKKNFFNASYRCWCLLSLLKSLCCPWSQMTLCFMGSFPTYYTITKAAQSH